MKLLIAMFIAAVTAVAGTALLTEYWDGRHAHDGAQMQAIHYAPGAGIEASSRRRDAPR
jgi:hypothetical protein